MYNIVNLQTLNNILETLILLTRGMVLHYEYQHENKGYSKLKYAEYLNQLAFNEFMCI